MSQAVARLESLGQRSLDFQGTLHMHDFRPMMVGLGRVLCDVQPFLPGPLFREGLDGMVSLLDTGHLCWTRCALVVVGFCSESPT